MESFSRIGQSLSPTVAFRSVKMQKEGQKSKYYCSKLTSYPNKKYVVTPLRSEGTIDAEKIINTPYFTRYQGKTQVYSLVKNDDISRRALHVTLVSRIARDIGSALCLNNDLIEAIALGHDLGHTPFGHLGESILDRIYYESVGLHFMHNVQSVRVLNNICPVGVSLETLIGILCHNGEHTVKGITPNRDSSKNGISSFVELNSIIAEGLEKGPSFIRKFVPSTHEGAVVRFSDMIAYIGKDRTDTYRVARENIETSSLTNVSNAKIIQELSEDLVENSFEKDTVGFSELGFSSLKKLKNENTMLYCTADTKDQFGTQEGGDLYEAFLCFYKNFFMDLKREKEDSIIYRHHINYMKKYQKKEKQAEYIKDYFGDKSDRALATIVVDYIQSMTDDYFCSLASHICPGYKFDYTDYFDDIDIKNIEYYKEKI